MTTMRSRVDPLETEGTGAANGEQARVRVRMYGQGLGDCFLLTFPAVEPQAAESHPRQVHVLIDCGVVMGTPDDAERMRKIVADIADATEGHLDVLVITHEHWDHLSGFVKAREEWSRIEIDTLWMAWTERNDPDGFPGVLKRILEKQRLVQTQIADYALRFGFETEQATVVSLMAFQSDSPVHGQSFAAAQNVSDAFAAAKALVPEHRHVHCEPGEVRPVPGTAVTCYVLGPPRSDARLRQVRPSRDRETYEFQLAADTAGTRGDPERIRQGRRQRLAERDAAWSLRAMEASRSFFNAFAMPLLGPGMLDVDGRHRPASRDRATDRQAESDWESYEQSFPFDRSHRVSLSDAQRAASEHPDAYPALAAYCDEILHWRRIDFDWLAGASEFALRADNLTNNTSLVLAFELPPSADGKRKVLLFVGDAQVGNWLSWDDIEEWLPRDGAVAGQANPDIGELLGRVVFYKVGHHGSHNATLKRLGVERMPSDTSLTAFVPVSSVVAREIKNWTEMPLESLLDALAQRSGGRVVFPNGNLWPSADEASLPSERERIGLTVSEKTLPAKRRVAGGRSVELEPPVPLWVETTIAY